LTEWLKGSEFEKRTANGDLGGTMRLGAYPARLRQGSRVAEVYGATEISERHRHRYEVNLAYRDRLEEERARVLRTFSGRPPARDHRIRRPSLVHRRPVPPRAQVKAVRAAPAVQGFVEAAVEQARLV
jgi:CTP synthase